MTNGVRKDEEFSGTRVVEERHRIDEASLDRWMKEYVEDYQGPLMVLQFKGGQSNPTYKLETPGRSYVMRRRPFGKLLPSAHAVDREFRVIAALGKQNFPVAKAYALCTDDGVMGSAFYIMSMEEGRVFWDPTLPDQTPDAARSRRWRGCMCSIPRRSGSAISASRVIISPGRWIVGPSSIAHRRRKISMNSRSSPNGFPRRYRSRSGSRSFTVTIASTI